MECLVLYKNQVMNQGEQKPFIRNVFTLNTCATIVGSQVLSFEKEQDLLEEWAAFVREVDPDVITGYNTSNFDFPYVIPPFVCLLLQFTIPSPKIPKIAEDNHSSIFIARLNANCNASINSNCNANLNANCNASLNAKLKCQLHCQRKCQR
jgi:hypothetical protein